MKFRIYDLKNKEYIKLHNLNGYGITCNGQVFKITETGDHVYGIYYVIISQIYRAEQFTGILDSQGKEIYIGDVLKVWVDGCLQDENYIVDDIGKLYLDMNNGDTYYRINQLEIVGNIHD